MPRLKVADGSSENEVSVESPTRLVSTVIIKGHDFTVSYVDEADLQKQIEALRATLS